MKKSDRDLEYEENIYDKNGRMIVTNLYTKNIYQKDFELLRDFLYKCI